MIEPDPQLDPHAITSPSRHTMDELSDRAPDRGRIAQRLPTRIVRHPPGATPRERLYTGRFVAVSLGHFLHGMSFFVFVFLPRYLRELGATNFELGIVMGMGLAVGIAARPWAGVRMDAAGRIRTILVAQAVRLLACLLYIPVTTVGPLLYVTRGLDGVGAGVQFAAFFAYASDISPRSRRVEGLAVFGVSGLLPMAFAPPLAEFVVAQWGYAILFLGAAILELASLAVVARLPDTIGLSTQRGRWRDMILEPALAPVWGVSFAFGLSLTSYFQFLSAATLNASYGLIGAFFTAYGVTAVVTRLFLGWVPDRVGPERLLAPTLLCLALGIALVGTAGASAAAYRAAGFLCGTGHAFVFPILASMVMARAPEGRGGAAMSWFTAFVDTGGLLGAPLLGLLADALGYPAMFGTAALGLALVAAATAFGPLLRPPRIGPVEPLSELPGTSQAGSAHWLGRRALRTPRGRPGSCPQVERPPLTRFVGRHTTVSGSRRRGER